MSVRNNFCDICNNFVLYPESHKCPPRWGGRIDGEERIAMIYAVDAEEAAEKHAADYNESDGEPSMDSFDVEVQREGTEEWVAFEVEPEATIVYHAREKEKKS